MSRKTNIKKYIKISYPFLLSYMTACQGLHQANKIQSDCQGQANNLIKNSINKDEKELIIGGKNIDENKNKIGDETILDAYFIGKGKKEKCDRQYEGDNSIGDPLVKNYGEDAIGSATFNYLGTKAQIFALSDGVGGCGEISAEFSYKFVENAITYGLENTSLSPKDIIKHGHSKTWNEWEKEPAAATACVITIHNYRLESANIGDSGCKVIRDGKVVFKTKEQEHKFNTPYAIGVPGQAWLNKEVEFLSGQGLATQPEPSFAFAVAI